MEMIQNFRKRSRVNTDIGKFFISIEEVRKQIEDLKQAVHHIKIKQAELLSVPMPTANDTRSQDLEDLHAKIKSWRGALRSKLKVIERDIQESEKVAETVVEMENHGEPVQLLQRKGSQRYIPVAIRIRKTQYMTLVKQFTDAMADYQSTQVRYRDQVKTQLKRQLEITNSSCSETEIEDMIDSGKVSVFTNSIITDTKVARKNMENIQARHNDLLKLEKSIRELTELFQDIAERVESQGDLVDNIQKNVTETCNFVEEGNIKFKEAIPLQKSLRKKKACLLTTACLILTIIIVVVIIVCAS